MTTEEGLIAHPKRTLRPVNLIPVGLKEAAWDSPSFRASLLHTSDQVDNVERWLESCIRATSRLTSEANTLEGLFTTFVSSAAPSLNLSEVVVDHDYSLVAAKRFSEAAKDSWMSNILELKRLDSNIVEPLRTFIQGDLRSFKDCKRTLEQTQKVFDQLQNRYAAQAKTKEPSSLREDAFQLHEARKSYLKSSLDFATAVPQLKLALDKVLARVFADQTMAMRNSRDATSLILSKYANELDRIKSWSKELEAGEKSFRKELQNTRTQIEEATEISSRPSRELEDYAIASSNIKGPTSNLQAKPDVTANGKQGWLNLKIVTGKQARTIWLRRWFFVKNGVFGWLIQGTRSGGIEESERIGVLLCGLRPAMSEERRFCFEVKTKDTTIVLQADSQPDLAQWMVAFDVAKQKALEEPSSTATIASQSRPQDLAFAISPPSTLEFTASHADVGLSSEDAHDRTSGSSLGISQDPSTPTHRGSFDVTASRRSSALDPDAGRSSRRTSATPQMGVPGAGPNPSTGIAGLISASNMTLPLGTGVNLQPVQTEAARSFTSPVSKTPLGSIIRSLPKTSLAPSTLVNPPVSTNLSNATVVLNGDKGNASAQMDLIKGTPSGMMANSWGSLNWGYNNLLERQDIFKAKVADPETTMPGSTSAENKLITSITKSQITGENVSRGHRKTVSLDGDAADLQRTIITPGAFPNYYPTLLKHHDAQFRVLFPHVSRTDKLVLVFRGTWNPSEEGDFPGRVFVTARNIYFYSNHLGLILTSSLPLERVTEITAAPGRECDYLFVHLKQSQDIDYNRITIKLFLEPLKLLQNRLNYLVQNSVADNQDDIETIMKTMLKFEEPDDSGEKSPSIASADGFDLDGVLSPSRGHGGRDLKTRRRIDRDIQGLKSFEEKDKFKLPSRPVNYVPNGMTSAVVEMNFKISPKALFHVLFGDRSAIWQLLYHERGASNVKQGPWTKPDQGFFRREFHYRIGRGASTGLSQDLEVVDSQTVDVLSEHLCYVVTERKSAWYLPHSKQLELVSKVVITHVAKSNCKLAIYTAINWTGSSILRPLIDHTALAGLKLDALDVMDVVSEQVNRLGNQGQSKKAIQIFGQIGQDTQTLEFKGTDRTTVPRVRHMSQRKSLTRLFFNAYGQFIAGCVNVVLAQIIAIFDWGVKTFDANFWLVLLFTLSLIANAFYSSGMAMVWWQDLRAGRYMQQLGISKDLVMTKAVSLSDLDLIVLPDDELSDNLCYQTFKKGTLMAPFNDQPATARLRKSRNLLGTYRHDLIVAMRVVNSMEQEMVRAEWEYWLDDEAKRCSTAHKLFTTGNRTNTPEVIERLKKYCTSCELSRKEIRRK